jgi:hypothetical protein
MVPSCCYRIHGDNMGVVSWKGGGVKIFARASRSIVSLSTTLLEDLNSATDMADLSNKTAYSKQEFGTRVKSSLSLH